MSDAVFIAELLRRTARGDRDAFELLYRDTSPRLYALCLRVTRNEALACDALQEAYVQVWRKAERFDQSLASPMTWLGTIVRNKAIDARRRQRGDLLPLDAVGPLPSDDTGPYERTLQWSENEALSRCLEGLGENQRRAVMHAFLDGMTHPEVSATMRSPLGSVKSWIRRGLDALRRCLEA